MRYVVLALLLLIAARSALAQCPNGSMPNPDGSCGRRPPPPAATAIAVLDFQNLSPRDTLAAAQAAEFIDALTERLQLVERLQVASRSAVRALGSRAATMRPAALGLALHVQYLVTGTVRRVPGRIRITAELVRASTGRAVWSQQLERSDVDLPTEFAIELASAVLGTLRPREQAALAPPSDSIAFVANTMAALPFSFPAGDTALQRVADRVTDVVTQRLQDGNLPSAADPAEVRAAWQRFGGADTLMDAVAQAYRVGRFTRAPYVLRGEVRREGARVRLGASLYGAQTRRRLAQRAVVTTPDSAEAAATVLLLQTWLTMNVDFAEHQIEWLARRNPDAVRLWLGPPAGTVTGGRGWYRGLLDRDSLLLYPVIFARNTVGFSPYYPPVPWFDTLAALAFQRRETLPRADRLLVEGIFGPWFGWADDAEARIELWQRIAEEVPYFFKPWEHLASQLTFNGPLTSIPGWRVRAQSAIASALRAHDSCATAVDLAFWFALFQRDTAQAARFLEIATRRQYRGWAVGSIANFEDMPHALAAARGDLGDTLYWIQGVMGQGRIFLGPGRTMMALARAVPAAVPTADALMLAWERDSELARRAGWAHWWVGTYWRDRGDRERWLRHMSLSQAGNMQTARLDEIFDDATRMRDVVHQQWPEDASTQRVIARLTRIARGDSVPSPGPGVVGIAHCWLAQWQLSHGDTSGAAAAIAHLRALDARDRAGLQDVPPNVHRWDVCPAILEAQLARVTGREQLAKARALDALLRPMPLARRGTGELDGSATNDGTRNGHLENLVAARLLAAAGDTAGALVAVRRRPRDLSLYDNLDNIIDFLREEGRFAAAMADTLGALAAYDHYLGLRPERPDYGPWAAEWEAVRAEVAALRRRP